MKTGMTARKLKGFTIVELMVVVAIIGALVAVIGAGLLRANKASVSKRITDDVILYAAQASNYRGAQTSYAGVSVTNLITQGLLSTGAETNPAGGAYTIAANTNNTLVDIGAEDIGEDICAAVAHKLSTSGGITATCATGTLTATFN